MKQNPSPVPAGHDDVGRTVRNGRVLLIVAVTLAAAGLLSLAAVLVAAWLGVQPWPGFMAAAYLCLPLAFLLMIAGVVMGVVSRGRS